MVKRLDFSACVPFVAFRNYIYEQLRSIKLNIVGRLEENYNEILVDYGENKGDVIVNDWYMPKQRCFVFFVQDVEEVKFEQCEYVFSEEPSFLFIDKHFKARFYDAESLGWHKNEKEQPTRYCAKEYEIYVVKCSKCGVISLVESIGAWYCRNCEYQNGDSDLIGDTTDFIPIFSESYRQNLKFSPSDSEYYYEDYEKPKTQKEEYDEYMNSDEWKEKREEIFGLKGRRCSICGTSFGIIDCHHLNYDHFKHEEEYDYEDVIPLCRDCHSDLHQFIKDNDNIIRELKSDLERLKDSFMIKYRYAIADSIYNRTKNIFNDKSVVKPYLDTIYGKCKCKNNIHPYFSSETLYNKLEKEGRI